MLTRKDFFKGLALGTISLPFAIRMFGGKNHAQETTTFKTTEKKYNWKMVTTWPPNFPILGEGCTKFANLVKEMSQGQMEITVYGGGELVPPLEVFDAVGSGAAEIGHGAGYYWAGKIPAAQFFASVPFGMNAQQMNAWMLSGGGLELWQEIYEPYNLHPMPCGNTGVQMGGWFNKEINTIEDFEGLKMRMPGLGGKVLERAGGTPVLLAGSELYTGLERGIIDATEWIGPYHDYKMGFHEIAKYYYTPGWHEPGTVLEVIFNKEKFAALPRHLQVIMETAALRCNNWMLAEQEALNGDSLRKLIDEEGVEVRKFSEEILDTLRTYTDEFIAEITATDPTSKRVYESYHRFRKNVANWSNLTEKEFYTKLQKVEPRQNN
ncbi:MAG: TRAP transporter substrate-binding protein [Saprospiraceae bacterium]